MWRKGVPLASSRPNIGVGGGPAASTWAGALAACALLNPPSAAMRSPLSLSLLLFCTCRAVPRRIFPVRGVEEPIGRDRTRQAVTWNETSTRSTQRCVQQPASSDVSQCASAVGGQAAPEASKVMSGLTGTRLGTAFGKRIVRGASARPTGIKFSFRRSACETPGHSRCRVVPVQACSRWATGDVELSGGLPGHLRAAHRHLDEVPAVGGGPRAMPGVSFAGAPPRHSPTPRAAPPTLWTGPATPARRGADPMG